MKQEETRNDVCFVAWDRCGFSRLDEEPDDILTDAWEYAAGIHDNMPTSTRHIIMEQILLRPSLVPWLVSMKLKGVNLT